MKPRFDFSTAWVPCPGCENPWCTIHNKHAFECDCPALGEEEDEMLEDKLPARLRQLREARRLSQQDLAAATGITQRLLSEYETGKTQPRLDNLQRIATALGVSLGKLLD